MQLQLFQRYEQLENSAANLSAGTGLGLSISSALVEAMGGRLQLESQSCRGSTFYFSLRLSPASMTDPAPTAARHQARQADALTGKSVLLVEDYETNQLIFVEFLKGTGCRITLAVNGREGVERFMAGTFDVVIMDMQMPVLDGWSATREIRAWEKQNGRPATPIIALTASALSDDRERSREAGCNLFLCKPLLRNELMEGLAGLTGGVTKKSLQPSVDASIERLLPVFLNETRKDLAGVRESLASRNWGQIARVAHQLVGSGGTFGFPEITSLGRELETAATAGNGDQIRELAGKLENILSTHPAP